MESPRRLRFPCTSGVFYPKMKESLKLEVRSLKLASGYK